MRWLAGAVALAMALYHVWATAMAPPEALIFRGSVDRIAVGRDLFGERHRLRRITEEFVKFRGCFCRGREGQSSTCLEI